MAGPILDTSEPFRKVKRALLAVAAVTILYGLSSVGTDFQPHVLGSGVKIRSWIMSAALIGYTIYLFLAFEHEYLREHARYNQRVFNSTDPEQDPAVAVAKLIAPLDQFTEKFSHLNGELSSLDDQRKLASKLASQFIPNTANLPSVNSRLAEVMKAEMALGDGTDETNTVPSSKFYEAIGPLRESLQELPAAVEADAQRIVREMFDAKVADPMRADLSVARLDTMQASIESLKSDLVSAHADMTRLSRALSRRERWMFQFYDVWFTRLLVVIAVVVTYIDVAEDHWPLPWLI